MTKAQGYLDGPMKSIINLLIPVASLLSFLLIGLFSMVLDLKFQSSRPATILSSTAFYMADSGALGLISIAGMFSSVIAFIGWLLLILKNKGQYLLALNRAIFIVIFLWIIGTLYIPFLLYLLYKPIL